MIPHEDIRPGYYWIEDDPTPLMVYVGGFESYLYVTIIPVAANAAKVEDCKFIARIDAPLMENKELE